MVDVQNAHMICTKCYVVSSWYKMTIGVVGFALIGILEGCTNRFIAKNNVYWIAMCSYAKHNNICTENA